MIRRPMVTHNSPSLRPPAASMTSALVPRCPSGLLAGSQQDGQPDQQVRSQTRCETAQLIVHTRWFGAGYAAARYCAVVSPPVTMPISHKTNVIAAK
jgi:hypothetical protein